MERLEIGFHNLFDFIIESYSEKIVYISQIQHNKNEFLQLASLDKDKNIIFVHCLFSSQNVIQSNIYTFYDKIKPFFIDLNYKIIAGQILLKNLGNINISPYWIENNDKTIFELKSKLLKEKIIVALEKEEK